MGGFELDIFLPLAALGLIAAFGITPYMKLVTEQTLTQVELPPLKVALLSATQGGVMAILATAAGLVIAQWAGLGVPNFEKLLSGEALQSDFLSHLTIAAQLGLATATIAVLLERFVFWHHLPNAFHQGIRSTWWKRALATSYGAISEELIVRLFFMSLFAWGLKHAGLEASGLPSDTAMWIAVVLSALMFGLLHLPSTIMLAPITKIIVIRTMALNGVIGLAAGWVFWEYGLIAAFVTHWFADIVILVIAPALILNTDETD